MNEMDLALRVMFIRMVLQIHLTTLQLQYKALFWKSDPDPELVKRAPPGIRRMTMWKWN